MKRQIVVRVDDAMYAALQSDADANGRTVAQSVRFYLRHILPGADSPSPDDACRGKGNDDELVGLRSPSNHAWLVTVEHVRDGVTGRAAFTEVEMGALRLHLFGRGADYNPWVRALGKLGRLLADSTSPVGSVGDSEPTECPTCGSDDPAVCNEDGERHTPAPGDWDLCCPDPWHGGQQ